MPGSANWEHDGATSRLASASAPNGVNSTFTYFALPHDRVLQSITHTGPGNAAISSYSYDYDAVGNITNWTQNQVSNTVLPVAEWKLSMDNSDQLTGVTVTGQPSLSEVFGYDNGGNRLTRQTGSAVSSTTFNDLNQIETIAGGGKVRVSGTTSEPANVLVQGTAARMLSATNFVATPDVNVGTNVIPVIATDGSGNSRTNNYRVVVPETPARSFTYDLNGNLTSDGLRTYESDGLNRLVKITQGTDAYEFAYDGFNRRVTEKKNGTLTKRFVWDGLTLAEERDANNNVTKRFFPQGEVRGTTKYFYTRDHLGSIREVTDASGAIVAAYSYDAWGKRTLLAGTDLATSAYTGHYTDPEINLVFAPYRAYDPETGRWLSRDPIGENGGINLYGYVFNNPGGKIDSDGEFALPALLIGGAAAVATGYSYYQINYGASYAVTPFPGFPWTVTGKNYDDLSPLGKCIVNSHEKIHQGGGDENAAYFDTFLKTEGLIAEMNANKIPVNVDAYRLNSTARKWLGMRPRTY